MTVMIKGREVNLRTQHEDEVGHVPEHEVLWILKRNSTTSRISSSVTKNFFRQPRLLAQNVEQVNESLLSLLKRFRFKFFERFSDLQLMQLVKIMKIQYAREGDYVIRKDEVGDNVYFLFVGQVDVIVREGDPPISTLGPGRSFGELALLYDAPRQASVRCTSSCAFATLARKPFNEAVAQQRLLEENRVVAHLALTPPFSTVQSRSHSWMAEQMNQIRVKPGYRILPDELADSLIMPMDGLFEIRAQVQISATEVLRGLVRNRAGIDTTNVTDSTFDNIPIFLIRKGDFFGDDVFLESELDTNELRSWVPGVTFTEMFAIARTPGKFLSMSRTNFLNLLQREKTLMTYLRSRGKIQYFAQKEQLQKIVLLLNRPNYKAKMAQYMKCILEVLDESLAPDHKSELEAFNRKVFEDGEIARAKQEEHDRVNARYAVRDFKFTDRQRKSTARIVGYMHK